MSFSVSILPVVVAAVANMVIGSIWYSKGLFGPQWMKITGVTMGGKSPQQAYIWATIVSIIEAYVLGIFINNLSVMGATSGAMLGFWVWLGFVVTTMSTLVVFEGRALKWLQITAGYQLVAFIVMGAILGALH